jgi:hypothetical protein
MVADAIIILSAECRFTTEERKVTIDKSKGLQVLGEPGKS